MASLECSVYPPFVIKEIKRLLKPNGVFVVTVGNIAFLPRRFSLLVGKAPVIFGLDDKGFEWDRLHSFTCKGISELVKNEGLDVEILSCSGVFAKRRKIWISLLSGDVIIKARKKSV
jgi:SAM-dependent methyltransferase